MGDLSGMSAHFYIGLIQSQVLASFAVDARTWRVIFGPVGVNVQTPLPPV